MTLMCLNVYKYLHPLRWIFIYKRCVSLYNNDLIQNIPKIAMVFTTTFDLGWT